MIGSNATIADSRIVGWVFLQSGFGDLSIVYSLGQVLAQTGRLQLHLRGQTKVKGSSLQWSMIWRWSQEWNPYFSY